MRILLTNDDGIHAEGLAVLERIARTLSNDVWVVAPETDQSGYAHSLSLSEPLRMRKIDDRHFAVRGTPTDCVIMGARKLMPGLPDLVLSGVNSGSNVADDVTYSGTVAGAMEGTLLGIRSIAISQAYTFNDDGRNFPYYWLRFGREPSEIKPGTDTAALRERQVSVTPLKLDLTAHEVKDSLRSALA